MSGRTSPWVMIHHVDDGRTEMVFDSIDRQIRRTTWASAWADSLDTREVRTLPAFGLNA